MNEGKQERELESENNNMSTLRVFTPGATF